VGPPTPQPHGAFPFLGFGLADVGSASASGGRYRWPIENPRIGVLPFNLRGVFYANAVGASRRPEG
jgi:hypothetical protein